MTNIFSHNLYFTGPHIAAFSHSCNLQFMFFQTSDDNNNLQSHLDSDRMAIQEECK